MRRGDSGCANMCDCNASGRDWFRGVVVVVVVVMVEGQRG